MSGLIFNGNGDVIRAVDGSLTVEGLDFGGGNIEAGIGTFTTLNVTGVLTYEDVKNVDSVGIVTARAGLHVQDDSTFYGVTSGRNVVWDKSENSLEFKDYTYAKFGVDDDLTISSQNTLSLINNKTGELRIPSAGNIRLLKRHDESSAFAAELANFKVDGAVELFNAGSKKFETTSTGIDVTGTGRFTENLTINTTKKILTNSSTGQLTIQAGPSYPGGAIKFAGGQSGATDRGTLLFYAGETTSLQERLRIKSNGYVGINETNPSYQVDVKGDSGIYVSAASNSTAAQLTISGRNSSGSGSALSRLKSYPDGSSTQAHFAIETRNSSASMVERLRITSDGEVLVGTTTSNGFKFKVSDGGGYEFAFAPNDGGTNSLVNYNRSGGAYVNCKMVQLELHLWSGASPASRIRLDSSGNFSHGNRVGTSLPATNQPFAVQSPRVNPDGGSASVHTGQRCNLYVGSNSGWASGDGGVLGFGGSASGTASQERMWAYIHGRRQSTNGWEYAGTLDFGTAGWSGGTTVRRARIWGDGQFEFIAASTENTKMSVKHGTTQTAVLEHTSSNNMRWRNPSSGNFTFDTSSDYRLKKDETVISNALTTIKALKPYQFTWKNDDKLGQGFFAHEAQAVLPDIGVVSGTKDGVHTEDDRNESYKKDDPIYQGIDYSKLVPLLTAALQEEVAKRESLEVRIAALESS